MSNEFDILKRKILTDQQIEILTECPLQNYNQQLAEFDAKKCKDLLLNLFIYLFFRLN